MKRAAAPAPSMTVTAAAMLRAIRAADPTLPALIAQTGGGCATIYVGPPDAADRYPAVIGPGRFDWSDAELSIFWLSDCYIGPDDDGETRPTEVRTLSAITDHLRGIR